MQATQVTKQSFLDKTFKLKEDKYKDRGFSRNNNIHDNGVHISCKL